MLGFDTFSEFMVYVTFIFFGMSVLVVTNTIYSMPFFFLQYYKYAQGNPDATPQDPGFWKNVFTYYAVMAFPVELLLASLMLTNFGRRIPIMARLVVAIVLPMLLVFSLMMVTIIKTTETGGKVTIIIVAMANGVAMALADSGNATLVGPFPTKFYSAVVWGIAVCGVVTSFFSIVIKASMDSDYNSMLTQSRIYFGLIMFMQMISLVLLVLLRRNPFAIKYAADFRYAARKGRTGEGADPPEEADAGAGKEPTAADADQTGGNVMNVTVDPDTMRDTDQVENTTNAEQMLKASVWAVFQRVWPMLFVCFFVFFVTYLVYPVVLFAIKTEVPNGWYFTIVAAIFNSGDFLSRLILQFKSLHPSPRVVLIGSIARVVLIIPLVFCVRGTIKGEWVPYILTLVWSFTYGLFGGMSQIYAPRTGSLTTAGERSLAANWTVVALLSGLFTGSMLALAVKEGLPA